MLREKQAIYIETKARAHTYSACLFQQSSDERNLMAKRFQNLYLLKCSVPFVETIQSTARWAFGNQRNRNSSAEKLRFPTGSWVFSGAFQSRVSISMAGRVVVWHEKDGRRNHLSFYIHNQSTQILWKKFLFEGTFIPSKENIIQNFFWQFFIK